VLGQPLEPGRWVRKDLCVDRLCTDSFIVASWGGDVGVV
jgi:hypothetical protein